MKANTRSLANDQHSLAGVLMDYYAAPGSYAVNLGQPVLIFQNFDTIIAWALGKINEELAKQSAVLQKAAIFFIQRACFRQENTYYDVMGLGRKFSPDTLRSRYRALISLTHPDKGVGGLPVDAAVRINKAYETLRDFDMRAQYDEHLSTELILTPRSTEPLHSSYPLNEVGLLKRLQAYSPNFHKAVIFVLPVLIVVLIVAMSTGQSPADLQLVEKSAVDKKSNIHVPNSASIVNSDLTVAVVPLYDDLHDRGSRLLQHKKFSELSVLPHKNTKLNNERHPIFIKNQLESEPIVMVAPIVTVPSTNTSSNNIVSNRTSSNVVEFERVKTIAAPLVDSTSQSNHQLPKEVPVSNVVPVVPDNKRLQPQLNEARFLATQLISALERPRDAESWQHRMLKQGVSGNLFGLVLPHIRQAAVIRVDQLVLKEKFEKNHLTMNGSVALWMGATSNQMLSLKYVVNIEFNNIESGPVVSSFELKEAR